MKATLGHALRFMADDAAPGVRTGQLTPLERLFALEQFGIKLGLDNIRTILAALGHPERAWQSIHIAGTNGKGSVAAMVERGLRAAGLKTGRYTSPHLDRIEERVAIDGQPIDRATFEAVTAHVFDAVDRLLDGDLPGEALAMAGRRSSRSPRRLRSRFSGGRRSMSPSSRSASAAASTRPTS